MLQVFMQNAPGLALKMQVHIWIELPHPGDNRMRMYRATTRATTFAADVLIREIGYGLHHAGGPGDRPWPRPGRAGPHLVEGQTPHQGRLASDEEEHGEECNNYDRIYNEREARLRRLLVLGMRRMLPLIMGGRKQCFIG